MSKFTVTLCCAAALVAWIAQPMRVRRDLTRLDQGNGKVSLADITLNGSTF
ncbi:MAG: hypothetical protein LAO55_25670 [Acidobacteriia bacterium]|nr:hypothetical protein [Terriglobia bacterium]